MSPAISNFLKVYSQAVFRISNLGIFGFGVILAVIFWQLFVPILSIFTLGILIFSLKVAVSRDFINQTLSNKKTFQIQDLITILKEHLNKPYLTETKLNFQNAKLKTVFSKKVSQLHLCFEIFIKNMKPTTYSQTLGKQRQLASEPSQTSKDL